ncbi:MAG: hypothetical protein EOP24_27885 [Hyphomicrobiales bacterium]|nr:MAG: hypothetical protein EOP24_27885 [Hyphomicrobiales bacterium]
MTTPLTSARVEQLKRAAKKLARAESIPLHEAQQRLANEHGYANWSLLHKHSMRAVQAAPSIQPTHPVTLAAAETPEFVVGNRNRQYLHGDQHERHPSRLYCRQCDEFVTAEHFLERHDRRETLGRALDALTRWHRPSNEDADMRPDNVHNILEDEARREAAAFERSRGEFHRWLERRKGKNSPIGDLAADVFGDRKFPVTVQSVDEAVSYLHDRFASDLAVKTMKQAWRQFEAGQMRKAPSI